MSQKEGTARLKPTYLQLLIRAEILLFYFIFLCKRAGSAVRICVTALC